MHGGTLQIKEDVERIEEAMKTQKCSSEDLSGGKGLRGIDEDRRMPQEWILKETLSGCEVGQMYQDRLPRLVKTAMQLRLSYNAGKFLTS